jgi:hypothetical protein
MSCSNNIVNTCGCGNPNPCGCKTSSDEVVYVGPELGCTGISNCDTVTEAFIKIDSFICGPGMVETIINNILNNVNLYNQFTTIVNNSVDCETVWGCIDSTTTTTSTSTAYPCQGYNLDNLSLDTVIISVTDCVTGLSTPVVLLPGITAVCIETASELIVPGVVNATPTGPCNTTTTTSSSTTSTTTTIYIPCQCITFTNTDNSAVDHNISYNNCVGEVIDTIITSSEVLKVCGCCAIADNPLVIISIGTDCIDYACPTTSTTTTIPPTTTTTTTGFSCNCLTFYNNDKSLHTIGYTNCNNDIITGININFSEIIKVCGSNGFTSDPLVTIMVGGDCVLGVCSEVTTTTTTTELCVQWSFATTLIEPQSTVVTLEYIECVTGTPITITQPAADFEQPFVFCSTSIPYNTAGTLISTGFCPTTTTTSSTSTSTTTSTTTAPPTTTTTTTVTDTFIFTTACDSGALGGALCCPEVLYPEAFYCGDNPIIMSSVLYTDAVGGTELVGANLWYKETISQIAYRVDNFGIVIGIYNC